MKDDNKIHDRFIKFPLWIFSINVKPLSAKYKIEVNSAEVVSFMK
jgi:hypothetical protein